MNVLLRYLPGLRILKTGLAVFICILCCQELSLELLFYAVIAAVISMDKNILLSFNAGKSRMIGTFLGALLGVAVGMVLPHHAIFAALGLVVLITLLNRLKLNPSITIASIVFLAIMVGFGSEHPVWYSGLRLLTTMLGIVTAWLVNILIFPYNNFPVIGRLRQDLPGAFESARHGLEAGEEVDLEALAKKIAKFESELDIYLHQFTWREKNMTRERAAELHILMKEALSEFIVMNALRRELADDPTGELAGVYAHHCRRAAVYTEKLERELALR